MYSDHILYTSVTSPLFPLYFSQQDNYSSKKRTGWPRKNIYGVTSPRTNFESCEKGRCLAHAPPDATPQPLFRKGDVFFSHQRLLFSLFSLRGTRNKSVRPTVGWLLVQTMACVTLKRPIDVLGSPHLAEIQPLAKRKRCGPPLFAATPTSPASRGVKRAKRRLDVDEAYSPNSGPASPVQSPFAGAVPPVDPGNFATAAPHLREEVAWAIKHG